MRINSARIGKFDFPRKSGYSARINPTAKTSITNSGFVKPRFRASHKRSHCHSDCGYISTKKMLWFLRHVLPCCDSFRRCYGHVTPLSKEGKLFCMAYAVVGIPMTLIMLTAVVERLMLPTRSLLEWLQRRLGRVYRPLGVRLIHLTLLVVFRVTVFMLIPAGVFAYIEPEWDYLDSLYYCFISLTTIGLGDYIPGDSPNQPYRPLYKVATTCYLLVGLMFMVLTLTVFHDIPQLNLGTFFALQKDTNTRDLEKVRLQDPDGSGPKYTEKKTSPQD
ncbi:unnamed protein product [Bemisia tabaci]|uniref:Potassium channel domain-containing protein n=1 Tax=Bemisia tabaci TaxID=7038 RepID=A0A9P0F3K7_BEMTA|nr:unnamed protein product [Bemisia tabaci]